MKILQAEHISKRFGEVMALRDVSFSLEKGNVCGLLGPNGAGKTTLLRIVNSILQADSGMVRINGLPLGPKSSASIGYMPEERGLYDRMKVEDQILYFGMLKGGDKSRMREVMADYLSLFNLEGQERRRVKELSKGNQQKVQIIATLVHEPELVILDEPFSGFDPINGYILRQLISRLKEKGTTVLLSSHNMAAIEEMCSHISLIDKGRMLLSDSIENIKEANKDDSILVTTATTLDEEKILESGIAMQIEKIPTLGWRRGYSYRLRKGAVDNADLVAALASEGGDILHFEESLPSLTDIFMKYTSGKTLYASPKTKKEE